MKVAILGTAPGAKEAPFDDPSWQIWACNAPALTLPRCDRIFEIHRRWWNDAKDKAYLDSLRKVKLPRRVVSIVPIGGEANTVIDREPLFEKYGRIWFSSSFGYMIACALEEGATDLAFHGIDMESREEYVVQFAAVLHFIDIARLKGVRVHVPDDSLLGREPVPYPDRFETVQALTLERKAIRVKAGIRDAERNLEWTKRLAYRLEGYRKALTDSPVTAVTDEDVDKALWAVEEWKAAVARFKGELFATQHYKRLFVWNVVDPDITEETEHDVDDCGPI